MSEPMTSSSTSAFARFSPPTHSWNGLPRLDRLSAAATMKARGKAPSTRSDSTLGETKTRCAHAAERPTAERPAADRPAAGRRDGRRSGSTGPGVAVTGEPGPSVAGAAGRGRVEVSAKEVFPLRLHTVEGRLGVAVLREVLGEFIHEHLGGLPSVLARGPGEGAAQGRAVDLLECGVELAVAVALKRADAVGVDACRRECGEECLVDLRRRCPLDEVLGELGLLRVARDDPREAGHE